MKPCAENFDFYECKEQCIIGVNMTNMYKLIKTMGNSDILTLFLENNNKNTLGIQINNKEKNSQNYIQIKSVRYCQ